MNRNIILGIFFLFSVCIFFALFTDHRWEDWYITYRVSKNLALGNGLVYNIGEYTMTYTSPIGTLLPAFIKFIFLNQSDDISIWAYRIICATTLASTSVILYKLMAHLKLRRFFYYFTLFLFGFNFLVVDNTINGMESAFMVFFELCLIYLLVTKPLIKTRLFAYCFAGIMFTRPDGFIYAGIIITSFILFRVNDEVILNSKNVVNMLKAIFIALLLFAPWLLWTANYYGTPIPHTIIAKSKPYSVQYLFNSIIEYVKTFQGSPNLFLPAYAANFGGWGIFKPIAQILSIVTLFYWLIPRAAKIGKALSFSSLIMLLYLNVVSGQGPSPWYMPSAITPTLLVLTFITYDLYQSIYQRTNYRIIKYFTLTSLLALSIFMCTTFYFGMRMIKYQQKIVETGNRKKIGLWLKSHANPKDHVFMECLGYIGFYSNLKTYDFPGMSSPEVVKARKVLKSEKYSAVIKHLKPEWIVLRAGEATEVKKEIPKLMQNEYQLAKIFDVRGEVLKAKIRYGEPFLLVDALFEVYHKR
jgi:hypothetical protein